MAKRRKMDDEELIRIITAARDNSLGVADGSLSVERAIALDHYHGRPYGNEVEGLSQVVSRDLSETIDWLMPNIMEVFLKSGSLVEFPPQGPGDDEEAEQATDYVNWVMMQQNDGFMVLHDACKDALVLKNGYVKHYWDERERTTEEEYEGLTAEQIMAADQEAQAKGIKVEVVGQEEKWLPDGTPIWDIKLKLTQDVSKVVIEATPTEEIRVSKNCRGSLRDADFVEHVTTKTRSDLIEMGMSLEFVDSLPAFNDDRTSTVSLSRDSVSEESNYSGVAGNRSMDEIEFCEAYIKVDYNGDGIAELRKVVTTANKIPPGKDWNEPIDSIPFTSFVCKRVPHRHVGESIDDELADLQEIKTTLFRQLLDNIFNTNHNQFVINDNCNIADFSESLPGGLKRINTSGPVTGSYEPLMVPSIVAQLLPAIDYVDNTRSGRTGISNASTGVDPDMLQNTTKGAYMENASIAAKKVEMYIRMLGECLRELSENVYALCTKYQDKAQIIKMRGKYVEVNPSKWKERLSAKVNIGLGTGTTEERRQRLMMLLQLQEGLKPYGLAGPEQIYQSTVDLAKTLGFDAPEKYALTPNSPEHQKAMQQAEQSKQAEIQAQSSVLANAEQVKGQFTIEKAKMDLQVKAIKDQYDSQLSMMKQEAEDKEAEMQRQFEAIQNQLDRASKEAIEVAKLEAQGLIAGLNFDFGPQGMGKMPSGDGE